MPDCAAVGRFTGYASYMMMRAQRHPEWDASARHGDRSTTGVAPGPSAMPRRAPTWRWGLRYRVCARGANDSAVYTLRLWSADACHPLATASG